MIRLALIAWLASFSVAHAQLSGGVGGFPGPGTAHSAGTYVGPGDVIAGAKAGYSFRAWSAATRGNNAVRVCNSGDAACADMVTNATTGDLTITTVGGVDCSVSTCTVRTLYDQSGALGCTGSVPCDLQQATEANRPIFKTSCTGGKPCMQCTASSSQFINNTTLTGSISSPTSWMFVGNRNGATTSTGNVIGSNGTNIQVGYDSSTNTVRVFAGTSNTPGTASDNTYHAVAALVNGASSAIYADGSSVGTGNAGTAAATTNIGMCATGDGNFNRTTGFVLEGGFWSGNQSSSFSTLSTNQHSYGSF